MFKIIKKSKKTKARLAEISTAHGKIQTPAFLPDATRGVLKHLSSPDLEQLGLQAMVVNAFHLYLQPGLKIIKKNNGVHKFINWHKPLLSDSGGYQVFSLIHKNSKLGKIFDQRIIFKSPIDGKEHILTPEKSIQIQFDLGCDIIVCLDDCPPNDDSKKVALSFKRTIKWALLCKKEYHKQLKKRKLTKNKSPLLFGVIQGGMNEGLRKKCAQTLVKIGFNGLGFGARPVDENKKFLKDILSFTAEQIPENYIRFGLGIGTPKDILECVQMGWDIFDCVIPTREARHGRLYVKTQYPTNKTRGSEKNLDILNIQNLKYKTDFSSINPNSQLPELQSYSRAYLHHLFKINEPLGQRLATLNNLEFYLDLMNKIRLDIDKGYL